MIFIIRSFLPLLQFGFLGIHRQVHAVVRYRSNGIIGDVAICGEKVTFVYKKRILVDLSDMTNILVIRGINVHMLVNIFLVPVGHIFITLLSMIGSVIVDSTC